MPTGKSEDSVTSSSTNSAVPLVWKSLAVYGEPNMFYQDDFSEIGHNGSTRSVMIWTGPDSKETSPAETRSPRLKQLLEAMIRDPKHDFDYERAGLRAEASRASLGFDADEFEAILHSRAGGAHHSRMQDSRKLYSERPASGETRMYCMASFMFVSPNDDWPYVCFFATCAGVGYQTVPTTETTTTGSRKDYENLTSTFVQVSDNRVHMEKAEYSFITRYISRHIDQTLNKLDSLISIVEDVERVVQGASDSTILADLIKQLHLCNVQHVRLQRRWAFQKQLMATVNEVLSSENYTNLLGILLERDFEKMKKEMGYRNRLVQAAETDLAVLPRRIENQFTALYNLSNQRDAKASVKIAEESAQVAKESARIAQATLNDSSSMKTIAVMTLIFLPATFACSFFSMTFFDWQKTSDRTVSKDLWVYFAVTVPVTVLVLVAWAFLTKKSRQESQLLRRRTMERGRDLEKND
ncbi:hypothetical protein M436DRAFT_84896 [Aureobasidium namibiae CBS 147.97]|uniref:Cora-domain-containing protein n=1 Tax=Aureobasidium namibiae CBS 147.97 TaxID=1043004 RepID=A0A074WJ21_9PEZI